MTALSGLLNRKNSIYSQERCRAWISVAHQAVLRWPTTPRGHLAAPDIYSQFFPPLPSSRELISFHNRVLQYPARVARCGLGPISSSSNNQIDGQFDIVRGIFHRHTLPLLSGLNALTCFRIFSSAWRQRARRASWASTSRCSVCCSTRSVARARRGSYVRQPSHASRRSKILMLNTFTLPAEQFSVVRYPTRERPGCGARAIASSCAARCSASRATCGSCCCSTA